MCPQKFKLHLENHGSEGGGGNQAQRLHVLVADCPLADLWVGGKLGATAGSTAGF